MIEPTLRQLSLCAAWITLWIATSTTAIPGTDAATAGLAPFEITYNIRFVGLGVGESTVRLENSGNHLLYTTTVTPRGVLAALFGDKLQINTRLRREDRAQGTTLVAEEYTQKHARNPDKDQRYRFEAHGRSVEVLKEGRVYFLAIPPGTLDEAGVQLRMIDDVRRHDVSWDYPVVSNGKIKHYRFTEAGMETIATTLGEIKALKIERTRVRDGKSGEVDHRYWLSLAHGHLPVKVERLKGGKIQRVMTVKTIKLEVKEQAR